MCKSTCACRTCGGALFFFDPQQNRIITYPPYYVREESIARSQLSDHSNTRSNNLIRIDTREEKRRLPCLLGDLSGGSMKVSRSIMHQIPPCPEAVRSLIKTIVQKLKETLGRTGRIRRVLLDHEGKKAPWKRWRKRVSGNKVDAITHGHHMVDECGSVVAQKGKLGLSDDVWLFGAFDQRAGDDGVATFLLSHLFEENPQKKSHPPEQEEPLLISEKQIARKATQTMKNAYHAVTSSMLQQPHESGGFACALLVNGERLIVTADLGGYRAVLCRGGKAVQLGSSTARRRKTDLILRLRYSLLDVISGKLFGHSAAVHGDENKKESVVDAQRLGSKTDFIILASCGVWEVLGNQEAVSLVRHVEDPQEAAKRLADEAVARMTKSAVVCEIIRIKRRPF